MLAPEAEMSQSITAPTTVKSVSTSNNKCFTSPTTSNPPDGANAAHVFAADE